MCRKIQLLVTIFVAFLSLEVSASQRTYRFIQECGAALTNGAPVIGRLSKSLTRSYDMAPIEYFSVEYPNTPIIWVSYDTEAPSGVQKLILSVMNGIDVIRNQSRRVHGESSNSSESDYRVNCHAYSCLTSGLPGFPEGVRVGDPLAGLGENSMSLILDRFFRPVFNSKESVRRLNDLFEPEPGDLIVLFDTQGFAYHSGIIVERSVLFGPKQTWIRSKFGSGGTYDVSPDVLAKYYEKFNFSHFSVYKKKF